MGPPHATRSPCKEATIRDLLQPYNKYCTSYCVTWIKLLMYQILTILSNINHCVDVSTFFFKTGQFSCPVWRDPLCEPAMVHPCPVHRHTALPQGQDQEAGEGHRGILTSINVQTEIGQSSGDSVWLPVCRHLRVRCPRTATCSLFTCSLTVSHFG